MDPIKLNSKKEGSSEKESRKEVKEMPNLLKKLGHSRKSRVKKLKSPKSSKNSKGIKNLLVIVVPIILILFFLVFYTLRTYFNIAPQPYLIGDNSTGNRPVSNFNTGFNVVFLGFNDVRDQYKFLKFIVVTSIDLNNDKIYSYGINPAFYTQLSGYDSYTFETLFNDTSIDNTNKMDIMIKAIESVVGIRIDRYVAFDFSHLSDIINEQNLSFTTDGGEVKTGNLLANYITQGNQDSNTATQVDTEFVNSYLASFRNSLFKYRTFYNINNLLKFVFTDMNRDELLLYFSEISNIDTAINTSYTQVAKIDANSISSADGITPDYIALDSEIANLFARIDIISEQAEIEIYNGSDTQGVASYETRVFEHLGATIVRNGNYPSNLDQTTLYIPNNNSAKFTSTIEMIRKELRGRVKIILGYYKYNYSGDMILVLGGDYSTN